MLTIGQKYRHQYINGLTCEVLELTERGAKIKEFHTRPKVREKTGFFDADMFFNDTNETAHPDQWKAWILIETPKILKP